MHLVAYLGRGGFVTTGALRVLVLAAAAGPDGTTGSSGALAENWLLIGGVAAAIVLVILAMLYLARYLRLAVNLFLDTPLPVTANLHDYTPPEGEIVYFPSLEGRQLRGMFIEPPAGVGDRGTILFCHEFGSDMLSAGRYAPALVEAGYTVFTFDFRGHGASFTQAHYEPRHWPSNHEVHDILAAVAYVKSQRPPEDRGLGVLGISRGASAAAVAAALNADIRCLAVDGAFSTDHSIDGLLKRWVQIFARVDLARADRSMTAYRFFRSLMLFYVELKCRCRFPSTRRALGRLDSAPILFIHGERDAYIPPEQTRALFDAKPGPKEIWMCPGAKHNQAVATDPDTYHRRLLGFFDRYLATGEPDGDGDAATESGERPLAARKARPAGRANVRTSDTRGEAAS